MNEKSDESAKQSADSAAQDQPPYREVSQEELKQILAAHQKWIESDGKEGNQADLIKANLEKADLFQANLQEADLMGANLQGADLLVANLQKANLAGAQLQGANLNGANLRGAELKHTNLEGAESLTQEQLDEACGDEKTKLPPGLSVKPCPDDSK
jgi:uncharacterized protein YjbI with pentapeptide repeats